MKSILTLFFFLTFGFTSDNSVTDKAFNDNTDFAILSSNACYCSWYQATSNHTYTYEGTKIMTEYECRKGRQQFEQSKPKSNGRRYYHITGLVPVSKQAVTGQSLSACYCSWYQATGNHTYTYEGTKIMTEYECAKNRKVFNQNTSKSNGQRYYHISGLVLRRNEVESLRTELSNAKAEVKKLNDKAISDINTKVDQSIKTHKEEIDKKIINTLNTIPDEVVNDEAFKEIKKAIKEELAEDYNLKVQNLQDILIELQDQINDLKTKKD